MVNVGGNQNLLVQSADMNIPNRGIDLAFQRTYNSSSQHDYLGSDRSQISNYGDGWTNSFDAHIAYNTGNKSGIGVSVFDGTGARYDYMPASVGAGGITTYAPPPGMAGTTVVLVNTYFYCWYQKNGSAYCFYRPDIGVMRPNSTGYAGRLAQIWGRNTNNYLLFTYYFDATPSTSFNLNQINVSTEAGEQVGLQFSDVKLTAGTRRLLTSLTRPDGVSITYAYDSSGNLSETSEPVNSVSSPACAGGLSKCLTSVFYYRNNHLLSNVVGPREIQNDYAWSNTSFQWPQVASTGLYEPPLSEVDTYGIADPVIPDGYSTSQLQSGYPNAWQFHATQYNVVGISVTSHDSDLHQT